MARSLLSDVCFWSTSWLRWRDNAAMGNSEPGAILAEEKQNARTFGFALKTLNLIEMNNLYILVWSFIAILTTWENLNSSTETLLVVEQEKSRQIIARANFTIFEINPGLVDIRHVRSQSSGGRNITAQDPEIVWKISHLRWHVLWISWEKGRWCVITVWGSLQIWHKTEKLSNVEKWWWYLALSTPRCRVYNSFYSI